MCDEWMPLLRLPLTSEQFHRLPRHPAYKYEYLDGQALLSPRTRFHHARLDLAVFGSRPAPELDGEVRLRPARGADFVTLVDLFAAAFHRQQPFASLDEAVRREAAQSCLERTRSGGDGPWIEEASFVAEDAGGRAVGAIFITLLPEGDPCDFETYYWSAPPPADCLVRRLGQPHLTWVFVAPRAAGRGLGTALLAAAGRALLGLGFAHLLSTFLLGNDSSILWHWRNGFDLLAHPASFRHLRQGLGHEKALDDSP
jgi:GNAT superfamily N-acetyltransferase